MSIYVFDLDGTLCDTKKKEDGNWDYLGAQPFPERIQRVNQLYDEGHTIIVETARGCVSGKNWFYQTVEQLKGFGLRFHHLRTGVKFGADFFIDDKGVHSDDFFSES